MAEDASKQNYENIWVQLQNFNAKTLRSYAVMLLDLAMESSVNEGNTTKLHFNVKVL